MKIKKQIVVIAVASIVSLLSGCSCSSNAHVHVFSKQDHDIKYLKEDASCISKAKYYYSCECGEKGEESFEYGELKEHTYDKDGICSVCQYHGKPLVHDTKEYEESIKKVGEIDLTDLKDEKTGLTDTHTGSTDILKIKEGGTYVLSGTYENGIKISKGIEPVHIYLNGANIYSNSGVAIDGGDETNVIITVVKDKTNEITNNFENKNAIHIKGNLVINGQGTLNVTSITKTAIKCKGKLQIIGPTLIINSSNHGISAESIEIEDTTIDVQSCSKDGINAENESDTFTLEKGYVSLKNVTYTCSVQGDGIQANSFVYIDGGTYKITTTGEYVEDTEENRTKYGLTDEDFIYNIEDGDIVVVKKGTHALAQSCRGIKVDSVCETTEEKSRKYCIFINFGNITINSSDSAMFSKYGNIILKDGTYSLITNNVALSAYFDVIVYTGNFNITSNEGVEASYILIRDGIFDFKITDDGLNATERSEIKIPDIIILDGDFSFTADNKHRGDIDAIDSNGRLLILGGTIIASFLTSEFLEAYDNTWIDNVILCGFCDNNSSFKKYISNSTKHILFINGLLSNDIIVIKKNGKIVYEVTNSYGCSKLFLRNEILINDVEIMINGQVFSITLGDSYYELNVR